MGLKEAVAFLIARSELSKCEKVGLGCDGLSVAVFVGPDVTTLRVWRRAREVERADFDRVIKAWLYPLAGVVPEEGLQDGLKAYVAQWPSQHRLLDAPLRGVPEVVQSSAPGLS